MKKICLFIIAFVFTLSSCNKFLDITPSDTLSPEGYFRNVAEVEVALAGVYDILGKSGTYGRSLFFELDIADDSFVALSSWTQDISLFNYNTSDLKLTDLWIYLHNGVNRANTLLANLDKADMAEDKRKAVEGQALFLRAYYFFLLTNYWGDIPMRLQPTTSVSDNDLKFTPVKDVYAQIVSDMERAAELVNPVTSYPHAGRVTKSVVWGVLARVNLKMAGHPLQDKSRYIEAKKWAEKVIMSGSHNLNIDYREVFIKMCKGEYDTKESIWEVEFNRYNDGQMEEGSLGSINGIAAAAEPWGFSYGAKHPTQYYFEMFENYTKTVNGVGQTYSPDMRRDWSMSSYYYQGALKNNYNATQIYNRMDAKWRREFEPTQPKFNGTTTINFPLLRYSDVLLMFAEADNEINGPTDQSIAYVNLVRRRAYGKSLGSGLRFISISNGGAGYTEEPQVNIVGGGGYGAEARALVSGGKITNIVVINPGVGYTSSPTIVFSGTGSGAVVTVEMEPRASANADLAKDDTDTDVSFRDAIRKERALELGFEGLRRFDLVRWGNYISTMRIVAGHIEGTAAQAYIYAARHGNNISSKDTLLAIPSREMQLNRAAIQNKGW
ncbi:RagB/SusD family nutrient uptake outer membrane protein [Sphingobacterium luzhongxinii]|uniref:RagB/SusD family nutrient uptake outer membrane protein n=1 Tax=Sphingobacterium luzhongxinii TaxID=2654181 RepID=UPI0013DAAFF3|nr:RagB/SusD family nutrient uptake outer membrane protein [Sphingobacterium sp. xlx-73]